jgi:hypothetical protein
MSDAALERISRLCDFSMPTKTFKAYLQLLQRERRGAISERLSNWNRRCWARTQAMAVAAGHSRRTVDLD